MGIRNSKYNCKKTKFVKNGYRQKIYRFVRFVMYCMITTGSVECYWHCSDETVHYKSDKRVNFCGFRCALRRVFINVVFYIYLPMNGCVGGA